MRHLVKILENEDVYFLNLSDEAFKLLMWLYDLAIDFCHHAIVEELDQPFEFTRFDEEV